VRPDASSFVITDTRGIKFLLKPDNIAFPEVESAAHIVVNRLLWACGYHVTEDVVVSVRADELRIPPHTQIKDRNGREHGELTHEKLVEMFAGLNRTGTVRAIASRWLPGTPIGGPSREGVRTGDANDRIPHEMRRDLRGEYPILAWVDHVDIARGNFVDSWISDHGHHYVEHFQIDFGRSLGAMAAIRYDSRVGEAYELDFSDMARSLMTLGIADNHANPVRAPKLRGVAPTFTVEELDPADWHALYPYGPFDAADRFDKFWGAKLMARFTIEQIRAAVDAARLTDPRAVDYIVDTLVARRRATLAYWFARVNPLDRFVAQQGPIVCFDDLAIANALAPATQTTYTISPFDGNGHLVGATTNIAATGARTCTPPLLLAGGNDAYSVIRIGTHRPGFTGATFVHLARDPATQAIRVVGIWRDS
jgi:hypothetical protein